MFIVWTLLHKILLDTDCGVIQCHSFYFPMRRRINIIPSYSKPSKEFEKYNPPATSTRFDFVKETYNNAKIAEDTDLLTVAYYKSDWISYTYEEALQEDLINCANGLFNKYNPWVTGTWRNY